MKTLAIFILILSLTISAKCQNYFNGFSGGAKFIAEYPYKTSNNFLGIGANATVIFYYAFL